MSNVIPFDFKNHPVRVVERHGEAWFVASDVSETLEYSEPSAMTRHLDDDEKGLSIVQTPGGDQSLLIINESGLYSAVLRSRKPEAKAFKKWVTSEVLPAIRKTGTYQMGGASAPAPDDRLTDIARASAFAGALDAAARAFGFDDNMRLLSVNQAVQKRTGVNLLGELNATHLISPINERYLTPTELGLPLDMSAIAVNRALRDLGYQRQQADGRGRKHWVLTDAGRAVGGRMLDTGKSHGDGTPVQQVKWPESVGDALREEAA